MERSLSTEPPLPAGKEPATLDAVQKAAAMAALGRVIRESTAMLDAAAAGRLAPVDLLSMDASIRKDLDAIRRIATIATGGTAGSTGAGPAQAQPGARRQDSKGWFTRRMELDMVMSSWFGAVGLNKVAMPPLMSGAEDTRLTYAFSDRISSPDPDLAQYFPMHRPLEQWCDVSDVLDGAGGCMVMLDTDRNRGKLKAFFTGTFPGCKVVFAAGRPSEPVRHSGYAEGAGAGYALRTFVWIPAEDAEALGQKARLLPY